MVRRKKSLLFSVSLASAGLVAGTLFVISPKTQATEEELSTVVTENIVNEISEDINIPSEAVESSLKTHQLLMGIEDVKELDENPDIIKREELAKNVYAVTFKDYASTSENYLYYKESEKASDVMLNLPLQLMETIGGDRDTMSAVSPIGYSEYDKCFATPNDQLTHTNFTRIADQCLAWGASSTKMLEYAKTITSANTVRVAVIDSGIRATHNAFSYASAGAKDRLDMSLAYDYVDNDKNPDDSGNVVESDTGKKSTHGTMVAATITESTPFNVKVVPIRISGGANDATETQYQMGNTILSAPTKMINMLKAISGIKGKVDVINLSLGISEKIAKPYTGGYALCDSVLKEAKDAGTIIVASAGNGGQNFVSWPAESDYAIGVSAVDEDNKITEFSQYGDGVDFAAPGQFLLLPSSDSDGYLEFPVSGTSFSSPYVAAAIANILSENPDYSYDDVYNTLKMNAKDLGDAGYDEKYGWGSVSFQMNKVADIDITSSDSAWTNGEAVATVVAKSNNYNITHFAIQNGDTTKTAPTSWSAVAAPGKNVTISKTVSSNGTYTAWVKNSNGEIKANKITVNSIDKTVPTISTGFKVSNITDDSATLSVGVKDTQSGLAKIVWHYKLADAEEYTDKTEEYTTTGTGATVATTKTFTLSELESGKTYKAYATVYDVAGNMKNSAEATFIAAADSNDVETDGDNTGDNTGNNDGDNTTTPTQPTTGSNTEKPKTVKTSTTTVKNPKTADINILGIAGTGVALSAAAFVIFRAKRR